MIQRVEIKLCRRYWIHLATTYFPTLCLFIVSEILLFMNEGHFETTIMVSLTAMLVMYTLHQSILSHLPKTSYLKMIDIWWLCGITIPFLVFMLEIISERIRYNKKQQKSKPAELLKGIHPPNSFQVKDTNYKQKHSQPQEGNQPDYTLKKSMEVIVEVN